MRLPLKSWLNWAFQKPQGMVGAASYLDRSTPVENSNLDGKTQTDCWQVIDIIKATQSTVI
jgi:hypothetical protein